MKIGNLLNTTAKWKKFAYILLGIQLILSTVSIFVLGKLNMLPAKYMIAYIVVLVLLLFVADLLLLLSAYQRNEKKNSLKIKHGAGIAVSAITMIVCILVIFVFSKLDTTLNAVAKEEVVIVETTAVYVLAEDSASELADVADYNFGYTKVYDYANTRSAISNINEELGGEIQLTEFSSVTDMVDALYQGSVNAMLLNETYTDILGDMDGYDDFTSKTKIIYENEIKTVQETKSSELDVTKDTFVMYVSGSDTRSTKLSTSRSDVNILAIINPTSRQVLLVNTPRDYYIETSISSGAKDKLTHCGIYGIECSMDTLGSLYQIDVDYYAQINFTGFETLVDAVGGIVVNSDTGFTSSPGASSDEVTTYSFSKGENYLGGKQALAFVRERHNLSDGDNARGRHQMAAIKALVAKLSSSALLTHYGDIMDSMEGMFSTSLSADEMSNLVKMQLNDGGSWNVTSYAVSGENSSSRETYSMPGQKTSIIKPDMTSVEKAKTLIQKVYDGDKITDEDVAK